MTHSPLFQGETLFRRAINCEQQLEEEIHPIIFFEKIDCEEQ